MSSRAALVRQARFEQRSFWRNPEAAFFTFALPVGLLLIFGATSGHDKVPGRSDLAPLTLFVPGILAFGIVVATYANLAATVTILRCEGVLKRIRATPLSPGVYLAAHLTNVLGTSLLIAAATITLGAVAFGISPRAQAIAPIAVSLALGITCFAALGLALSGFIPNGGSAGAITNGTYLPLALVSGTFSSSLHLPGWLDATVSALPIKALTDALRAGYDPAAPLWRTGSIVVLAAWALIGAVLARRYFRWEPS